MARSTDLPGIKKVIQPLEESGALVRRTNEEVCISLFYSSLVCGDYLRLALQKGFCMVNPELCVVLSIEICTRDMRPVFERSELFRLRAESVCV